MAGPYTTELDLLRNVTKGDLSTDNLNIFVAAGSNVIGKVSIDQTTPGTTNLVQVGGSLPTGSNTVGAVNLLNSSATGTVQAAQSTISISCVGLGSATMVISGLTGLLNFEASVDGTTFFAATGQDIIALNGQIITSTSANGTFKFDVSGLNTFRVRTGTLLASPATVSIAGSNGSGMITGILNTTFISGTVTANAGTGTFTTQSTATGSTEATAPTKATLAGAKFSTTPTTLLTGQMGELNLDSSQNLLVNLKTALPTGANTIGALTANQSVNFNQFGGSAVVNGGVAGVQSVAGNIAAGTAPTTNPLRVAGLAFTAAPTARATGTLVDLQMTTTGAAVVKPYSVDSLDYQATSGITALATNTSTPVKAAGAAGIRNYVTALQVINTSATVSTLVSLLDGAAVIWTGYLPATTASLPVEPIIVTFPTPLKGTAATALNIQANTTGANIYYNVQGYQAP